MGDILQKKGYYDAMITSFEAIRDKREAVAEEVVDLEKKQRAIMQKIAFLQQNLADLEQSTEEKTKELDTTDGFLVELEAGGVRAKKAMMRLSRVSLTIEERAAVLRQDLAAEVFESGEPVSPKMGSSKQMHNEAVQTTDYNYCPTGKEPLIVRCYSGSPPGTESSVASPVLVYFHGEGYVAGDLDTHDWLCRSLAAMGRITVVAVDYRRAPEARFPTAFEDAYGALKWVAHGGLGEVPTKLGVAGDCAGGGLAAACCLHARDDPDGPVLQLQVLFYPWLDLRPDAPSLSAECGDGGLVQDNLFWYRHLYAPEAASETAGETSKRPEQSPGSPSATSAAGTGAGSSGSGMDALVPGSMVKEGERLTTLDEAPWYLDPRASPVLADSLSDLPRAFIAYAEDDPVSVDAIAYAERLTQDGAGPEAVHTLHLAAPCGHGFAKLRISSEGRSAVFAAAAFASAALKG